MAACLRVAGALVFLSLAVLQVEANASSTSPPQPTDTAVDGETGDETFEADTTDSGETGDATDSTGTSETTETTDTTNTEVTSIGVHDVAPELPVQQQHAMPVQQQHAMPAQQHAMPVPGRRGADKRLRQDRAMLAVGIIFTTICTAGAGLGVWAIVEHPHGRSGANAIGAVTGLLSCTVGALSLASVGARRLKQRRQR